MRTKYQIDEASRPEGGAVQRILEREAQGREARRRRWLRAAGGLVGAAMVVAGLWAAWQWASPPAPVVHRAAEAPVPEHQRSGPLANPWGSGAPVVGTPEGAASAAAVAAAASAVLQAPARPDVSLASPAAREAVRAALVQLRASAKAADFVRQAIERRDPPALVAAWMAERHCRQVTQWRLMFEWHVRAANAGTRTDPGALPAGAGVHPQLRALLARCGDMPDDGALDAALAAAGFASTSELAESTRRPIDVARAVSMDDPILLAAVVDASSADALIDFRARIARPGAPAETAIEVLKAALWLASCRAGPAGAAARSKPACAEHPALWQACTQQGLCDVRDLNDLLLRTMPAEQWHASERLAAELVPLMGR